MSEDMTSERDGESQPSPPLPGPDALYGSNPTPPQLENGPGWDADPLLVSGCEGYVAGEYLYQDYVYDDHGADTRSLFDPPPDGESLGGFYSRPTGDYRYPTDEERYGYNGADLLEFRARPTDKGVAYRITLNTLLEADAAAVAVGIDTSGGDSAGRTDWGYGLGELGASVDHRLVTWGTGAELDGEALEDDRVSVDIERNQLEVEVPLEPGRDVWRHYLVVGLWDRDAHAFRQVGIDADEETPGGQKHSTDSPPVFNVGFRFDEPRRMNLDLETLLPRLATILANAPQELLAEFDDPMRLLDELRWSPNRLAELGEALDVFDLFGDPLRPPGAGDVFQLVSELERLVPLDDVDGVPRALGHGNWHDHRQATALAARDISEFHADIDFATLRDGDTDRRIPESGHLTFLYPSRHDFGTGIDPDANVLQGRIQPYSVYLPETLAEPAPLVMMLHSLGNCHTQYSVYTPTLVRELSEANDAVVMVPQARGPGIWYKRAAELDVFEAWRDLETRIEIDRERVSITGYSMGGFGALMLATKHPDLFGRCFAIVGPLSEDPLEAPTNSLLSTPSFLLDGLLGGEDGGELFSIFTEEPENALRITDNLRHVPMLLWHGGVDPAVPILGPTNYASKLREHGYRHRIDVFPAVDHLLFALQDRWDRGPEYLADATVPRTPTRVTYRRVPAFDYPSLDLVHDGAYWVSDIVPREDAESGLVDAISLADGYAEPVAKRYTTSGSKPLAYTATGVEWAGRDESTAREASNGLEIRLEGVASATLWITEAGLDPSSELTVSVESDGESTLTLAGSFGRREVAVPAGASTLSVDSLT